MQHSVSYQDDMPDEAYSRIIKEILHKACEAQKGDYFAYVAAKREHAQRIGYLWGDPRYDEFIRRLTDILQI